jgi:hypothetical protein
VNTCPVDRKIFNTIEIYSSINGPLLRKIHVPDRRFEDVLIDPNDVTCCEVLYVYNSHALVTIAVL